MSVSDPLISITLQTKGRLPSLPFVQLKDKILGKSYDLSIVSVSPSASRKLNSKFRRKNRPTNILSFPLTKHSGEIILCLPEVKKDAPQFRMPYKKFLGFLLIHGMLHLKGYAHGSTMEKLEEKWKHYFKFT